MASSSSSSSSPLPAPPATPPAVPIGNSQIREDGTHAQLPCGFRFVPSEKDLVESFLFAKVKGLEMPINPIKELDIYSFNPEDLPITISNDDFRWMYFFVYMNESEESKDNSETEEVYDAEKENRFTPDGYWRQIETDKPIQIGDGKNFSAMKNTFIYYTKELGPNWRYKTNWTMDEFRIVDIEHLEDPKMKNWVLCKIETKIPRVSPRKTKRRRRM